MPSAVRWLSFICDVLLYRFFDYTFCSNLHSPTTWKEHPPLLSESPSDLWEALICLSYSVLQWMTGVYYVVLHSMAFVFCVGGTSSVCTTFTVLILCLHLFCFATPYIPVERNRIAVIENRSFCWI